MSRHITSPNILDRPPEKPPYKCTKTSLKSIARNDIIIDKLTNIATIVNKITIHTLQFLKLYLLDCYDKQLKLPRLNQSFILAIMKIICKPPSKTGGALLKEETKILKDILSSFYQEHYQSFMHDEISYINLGNVLKYLSDGIVTMYEINIKQHFHKYVERFVNVLGENKQILDRIKNDENLTSEQKKFQINQHKSDLRKVKNDILSINKDKTCDPSRHIWIDSARATLLPQRAITKDNINYDIEKSPQDYLRSMIYMMKEVEAKGEKIYNLFPLRSEIISKHFRLDTISLVRLLFEKEHGPKNTYVEGKGNIEKNKAKLWNFFFKTNKKCFHTKKDNHAYTFDHMIETDGVSCSILLIRKDLIGQTFRPTSNRIECEEKYIDNLHDYSSLRGKNIVAIDPNLSDLLYCVNSDIKDQAKFRYTQNTRRKETKVKKYRQYLETWKQKILDGKTITQWESELSPYNKKTLNFIKFKSYIQKKNEINHKVFPFYNQYIFRKLKLGSYMRRQITEARMLNKFKEKFGNPSETIIAFGDFEQKHHRNFSNPSKVKVSEICFGKLDILFIWWMNSELAVNVVVVEAIAKHFWREIIPDLGGNIK